MELVNNSRGGQANGHDKNIFTLYFDSCIGNSDYLPCQKWSVQEEASGRANQNRLSAGMLIGMSLGLALGSVFRFNVGLTTVIGMLIGMTIAHYIGK